MCACMRACVRRCRVEEVVVISSKTPDFVKTVLSLIDFGCVDCAVSGLGHHTCVFCEVWMCEGDESLRGHT